MTCPDGPNCCAAKAASTALISPLGHMANMTAQSLREVCRPLHQLTQGARTKNLTATINNPISIKDTAPT